MPYDFNAITHRLGQHCAAVARTYPNAWKQVDQFRADRGKRLPDWPQWCFLPLAVSYAIATGGRNDVQPAGADVAVIGALAPWRTTRGIYAFDETLLAELWDTPVSGDIPVEILRQLPEWCCYLPFPEPRRVLSDMPDCRGFFVHLEHDPNQCRTELRLLLDYEPMSLSPIPIHLVGDLRECIDAALDETLRQFRKHGSVADTTPEEMEAAVAILRRRQPKEIEPLVSLVLYLCSTNAEIVGRDGQNKPMNRPLVRHTKRGARLFPPPQAQFWEVGWRLGKTLRAAAPQVAGPDRGGTHASPRPHLRRAHWHGYWMGPKAKVGVASATDRRFELKWIPPTLIGVSENRPIVTVHPVRSSSNA